MSSISVLFLSGCTGPSGASDSPAMTPVESSPAQYDAAQDAYSPVVVTVTNPPIAAPATDGRMHLAYELLLVNASASPEAPNAPACRM